MARGGYSSLEAPQAHPRDSLELASLASSTPTSTHTSTPSSPSGISSSRKLSLSNDDPLSSSNRAASGRPNTHHRSYSVSSAFDFASNLFPLSSTTGGYTALGLPSTTPADLSGVSLEKHKSLTYLNGVSLVVGAIIGSGIFSSPSQVSSNVGSPGASLIVWAVAGVLAWTGAASYAELGGAIPLNGGAQVYLSKIFGDLVGFLFTWCAVVVLKPGSAAIVSIIFGEYIVRAAVGAEVEDVSVWVNKGVALAGLAFITFINCISTKIGTKLSDFFMFFKFIALIAVTIIGIVVAVTGFSYRHDPSIAWKTESWLTGTSTNLSSWAVALYGALWSFDGWENSNYVAGEFLNPARDLPRTIHTAMPLVILSYLLANIAYIFVLPASTIDSTNTIAVKFGFAVFGPPGSLILALIVSASSLGTINATTFTSGRLVYAAGKDGFMPSVLGRIGLSGQSAVRLGQPKSGIRARLARLVGDDDGELGLTPINALLFNASLSMVYILVGEFGTLVTFYGVASYTFYFLTVLGLIVLRIREPYLERPYKTWLSTPIIFCCVSLFLLSRAVFAQPVQTLVVVAFVGVGVPVYWFRVRGRGGRRKEDGGEGWKFWKRWRSGA